VASRLVYVCGSAAALPDAPAPSRALRATGRAAILNGADVRGPPGAPPVFGGRPPPPGPPPNTKPGGGGGAPPPRAGRGRAGAPPRPARNPPPPPRPSRSPTFYPEAGWALRPRPALDNPPFHTMRRHPSGSVAPSHANYARPCRLRHYRPSTPRQSFPRAGGTDPAVRPQPRSSWPVQRAESGSFALVPSHGRVARD